MLIHGTTLLRAFLFRFCRSSPEHYAPEIREQERSNSAKLFSGPRRLWFHSRYAVVRARLVLVRLALPFGRPPQDRRDLPIRGQDANLVTGIFFGAMEACIDVPPVAETSNRNGDGSENKRCGEKIEVR
jgi:hypothetical protein